MKEKKHRMCKNCGKKIHKDKQAWSGSYGLNPKTKKMESHYYHASCLGTYLKGTIFNPDDDGFPSTK